MDIELPLDFKEFLKLLNENGVRYLLIGGYAETFGLRSSKTWLGRLQCAISLES